MNNELSMGTNSSTVPNPSSSQLPPATPTSDPAAPQPVVAPAAVAAPALPGPATAASEVARQPPASGELTPPASVAAQVRTGPERITINPSLGRVIEMSEEAQRQLFALEQAIGLAVGEIYRNFVQIGLGLTQIREKGLYEDYGTFEEYCRKRWDFAHSKANYMMRAAAAYQSIAAIADVPKPERESPLRPLLHLKPDEIQRVWKTAVERTGGVKITARLVKNVVQSLKLQIPKSEPRTRGTTKAERHRQITECFGQVLTLLSHRADPSSVIDKIQELHLLVEGLFVKTGA